jgi:hypothetical protein
LVFCRAFFRLERKPFPHPVPDSDEPEILHRVTPKSRTYMQKQRRGSYSMRPLNQTRQETTSVFADIFMNSWYLAEEKSNLPDPVRSGHTDSSGMVGRGEPVGYVAETDECG